MSVLRQVRVAALLVCAFGLMVVAGCGEDNSVLIEQHRAIAGELQSNGLYKAAIAEYVHMLAYTDLPMEERGNLNYLIARLYFDELHDYEHAAAYYVRAREFSPDASYMTDAGKNLVASLEKLGNIVDARRNLSDATNIDDQPRGADDLPVAKIGSATIWLSDIDNAIRLPPAEQQRQLATTKDKIEFARQYVGTELLHNAAVREGWPDDPTMRRQQEELAKRLVVDRFVSEKILSQVKIDQSDVLNFYQANIDSRYGGAAYDSVRERVVYDYRSEKSQAAYAEYVDRLARAEQVEFLDHNIK